jgi:hypothetical protein
MKLNLLFEGEFDSPDVLDWKIQHAAELAKSMEGWDVNVSPVEQNRFYDVGNHASVAARFFEKDVAKKWLLKTEADKRTIQKWFDERFGMPCFLAMAEFDYPEE